MRAVPGLRSVGVVALGDDRRVRMSWFVAVLPLITIGFASSVPFVFAAVRTRERRFTIAATIYTAVMVACILLLASTRHDSNWQAGTPFALLLCLGCLATGHALAVRQPLLRSVLESLGRSDTLAVGRSRIDARDRARRIVRDDPKLADELRIGRPDLKRYFDDGGLVDVNHVPVDVLARLPDLSPDLAQRLVTARESVGSFDSVDDITVLLHLAPQELDHLRDILICRR